jgi:hypothetical protein
VLGYNNAAMLIDAAGSNSAKLSALQLSLNKKYDEAKEQATRWSNRIKTDRRAWDNKARDKAKVATYFKDVEWKQWKFVLETEDPIQDADGNYHLDFGTGTSVTGKGVWIGDIKDWEKEIAVHGFFGSKIDELNTEDIVDVLNNWDNIRLKIETIRDRRLDVEAMKKRPMSSSNPIEDIPAPEPPEEQDTEMNIQDAPADTVEYAPADTVEDAPADTAEDAPTDTVEDAPADTAEDAPTDTVEDAPADTVEDAPADTVEDAPADTVEDAPADTVEDAPADTVEDAPADTVEDAPADTVEDAGSGLDADLSTQP